MSFPVLPADPSTVVTAFDRRHDPVLRVEPGDTVRLASMDAGGHLDRPRSGRPRPPQLTPRRAAPPGHFLTGPIAITGARPGDLLAVRLDELVPAAWGWTMAGGRGSPVNDRIGVSAAGTALLDWDITADPASGTGTATTAIGSGRVTVPVRPFLGVVGLAPDGPGPHPTVPPRPATGGNIDCRELVAGATLYLPVAVPDALLYLGDGHAAQGDGEAGGTAIECAMTSTVTVDVVRADGAPRPPGVHATTPAGRITFGFAADLDTAAGDALAAMVDWLQILLDEPDRAAVLALAGVVVDLRVTQIVNGGVWGVHAVLAPDRLRGV